MGILNENLIALRRHAPPPRSMLELGNQYLCAGSKPYPDFPDHLIGMDPSRPIVAKPYFESLGYEHVSVDLNGKDGALVRDLSKPFSLDREFDVVTDFGTSEHVECLWACLENVHRHTRVGGLIFCANPAPGNWPGHGHWYRSADFCRAFASAVGYEILELAPVACAGNTHDGWLTSVVFRKTRPEFMDTFAFYRLPLDKQ
jgi:hypothetical protein